jgi:hypothetical protein
MLTINVVCEKVISSSLLEKILTRDIFTTLRYISRGIFDLVQGPPESVVGINGGEFEIIIFSARP